MPLAACQVEPAVSSTDVAWPHGPAGGRLVQGSAVELLLAVTGRPSDLFDRDLIPVRGQG